MVKEGLRRDGGFTLVELLVVIVVLGVLAAVVVFAVRGVTPRGQESACDADAKSIEVALEAYYAKFNGWPSSEATLVPLFLRTTSAMHDLSPSGTFVDVVPVGDCL